ncbi:MAG: NFACT family protein [Candidatus Anstonellales archaeon]
MLRQMERLECLYMLNELRAIVGSRLKKLYMLSNNEIKIAFQKANLIITLGKRINILTKERNDYIEHWFTKKIRKELENKVLNSIYMLNGDRIFVFEFDNYKLIVSLYGKGNICLYKNEEKIACLTKEEIRIENHDLTALIEKYKDKPIGAVLVRYVGKRYMPYILNKLKINEKNQAIEVVDKIKDIEMEVNNIIENFKPAFNNDYELKPADNLLEWKKTESLSEAMDMYYVEKEKKENKIEKAIKIQEENIIEYQKKADYYKRTAEFILKNAGILNELIYKIKDDKLSKEEVEKKGIIINKKDRTFEIQKYMLLSD